MSASATAAAREQPEGVRVASNPSRGGEPVTQPRTLTDGRLGTRPSSTLVENVNRVELDDEIQGIDEFVLIDIAHALMLTQEGIFDTRRGGAILGALLLLHDDGPAQHLHADPEVGTLGLQIERYLEETCGSTGLDIQRARSRIDQKATGWRMINRRALTSVIRELLKLQRVILEVADRHSGLLLPGYTHLQHSQPTTFDHYLNAHFWAFARNAERLFQSYDRLNVSPLGGAAYSGTSWPINRESTARYLGFSSPIPNSRDAGMASIDMGAELTNDLALVLSAVSRLASDLYYWASSEVGLVQIDASLCGTSSMMPQKRNPMTLERIRGLAGSAAGWSASQLGVMHTSTSTDVDQAYTHNVIPGYCAESVGAIALLREVLETLEIDTEGMSGSAGRHWSTASALADELARSHGLSFRAAHETVARFISAHERVQADSVRTELAEAPLNAYSRERMNELLDPRSFVDTRVSLGATSEASRATLATLAAQDLTLQERRFSALESTVRINRARLIDDARALAN